MDHQKRTRKFEDKQRLEWAAIVVVYLALFLFAAHCCLGWAGVY